MKLSEMTKQEKSLLVYLEVCLVDSTGKINGVNIDNQDIDILKRWSKLGFIDYGRIHSSHIHDRYTCTWCTFSNEAWKLAHKERKLRSNRMLKKRAWRSTEEVRNES